MYTPPYFRETDLARLDWLAAHDAFVTLISTVDGAPFATHLPVLYHRDGQNVTITGHWARANPQWKSIEEQRALLIFHGPHAYISARWYQDAAQQVPTWDYAVAHLYGRVRLQREPAQLEDIVARLADKYESGASPRWPYDPQVATPMLKGIVGFELQPDDIQLKFKLNQNHPPENVRGAIAGLEARNTDDAREIAMLMRKALEGRGGA
jgi:transcriptional regulator